MKTPFLFLLLLLCAGCAKTEFTYGVVCDFPASLVTDRSTLVVSNDEGDILKSFPLQTGQRQLVDEFDFKAKNAVDHYNLHLVIVQESYGASSTAGVISYYNVKNGSAVAFGNPYPQNLSSGGAHLIITNVPSLNKLEIPGAADLHAGMESNPELQVYNYDSLAHLLHIYCTRVSTQGLLLRIRTTTNEPFFSTYAPADSLSEPFTLDWAAFSPENNFQSVTTASGAEFSFSAAALKNDLQQFVSLATGQDGNQSFNIPMDMVNDPLLVTSTQQRSSVQYFYSHIFQTAETLRIEDAPLEINNVSLSAKGLLETQTEGDIDLLEVLTINFPASSRTTYWYIQGEPAALQRLQLPNLKAFLPDWFGIEKSVTRSVKAYQYEALTYEQIREGAINKDNNGAFSADRYNYKTCRRQF